MKGFQAVGHGVNIAAVEVDGVEVDGVEVVVVGEVLPPGTSVEVDVVGKG